MSKYRIKFEDPNLQIFMQAVLCISYQMYYTAQ